MAEWVVPLIVIVGGLIFLMMTGFPVAFSFLTIITAGTYVLWGGESGMDTLTRSLFGSISTFTMMPLAMFLLMGEVMFRANIAQNMIDALDAWMGRLPGRLGLVAVAGGVIFSTLSGASQASVAMLGGALVPEMEKRGYKKPMSLGPILGSGGLAMMIPPSGLVVLLGAMAGLSISKLLMAIIIPGLLMAVVYAAYIILRCWLQPDLAPKYEVQGVSLGYKLKATAKYILPIGIVIFLVIGLMLIGVATPTEASAAGAMGCILLAAAYRKLTWKVLVHSFRGTTVNAIMVLLITSASKAFSQMLSFTGVSRGIIESVTGLDLPPIMIIVAILAALMFLGMFIAIIPIMMVTVPIIFPLIQALGFDPIWFSIIYLLAMEVGTTSPPFGLTLFVMKSVATPDTTMGDCYRAAIPFLACDLVTMALIIIFPAIALWLPAVSAG